MMISRCFVGIGALISEFVDDFGEGGPDYIHLFHWNLQGGKRQGSNISCHQSSSSFDCASAYFCASENRILQEKIKTNYPKCSSRHEKTLNVS